MQECRAQALAYYEKHGLPKKKGEKASDDDGDEEEEPDTLELVFGEVNFTRLHTSPEIKDRACGGRFFPSSCNYDFNIKLAIENPDEYYEQVVPHEIAHHIQYMIFPESIKKLGGHGKEWKGIMKKVFNISPDRYHQMDTSDVRLAPDLAGDYHYVKGYTSAKGLFRILFENKKKIVVLDDCDAAWKNEVSANLLKAALDSDEERWISWNVEGPSNEDLPKKFLFDGKVIFISNVKSEDFPQPLITRALRCDVELTIDERFERMLQILPSPKFAPDVDMEVKMMAYNFLYENKEIAAEISSRSLLNVIQVANSGSKLWKRIALSNIC
jgi:predicted SprT family Zn-dependent metalloprotease